MNKNIFIIIAAIGLLFFSCADDELGPVVTFDTAGKGAYVRVLEQTDKLINLFDVAGSVYTYSVEFVDLERGALVQEYNLNLTFDDNDPDNGDKSVGPIDFRTYVPSDFTDSPDGYKAIMNISVPATELISAAGITEDDISAGDNFIVKGSLILTDGSVFSSSNSSSAVNGTAFAGHFDYTLPAACPSSLEGTYSFAGSEAWCEAGSSYSGEIEIIALGGGVYTFDDWSLGSYPYCYGGLAAGWGTIQFADVCNEVAFMGFTDNYGDTWTFESTVDGTEWTISYENTYGESGSAVITNPNGWPFTLK